MKSAWSLPFAGAVLFLSAAFGVGLGQEVSPIKGVESAGGASAAVGPAVGVPMQVNHQGVVSVNGQRFTGTGLFRFAIIDPVLNENIWTNDGSAVGTSMQPTNAVQIPCSNGLYSVRLGDTGLSNMTSIMTGVFGSGQRSLRIWFSDGTNGVFQLTPDHVLTAAPYAYKAFGAEQLNIPGTDQPAASADANGNVGIGTTNPGYKLDVNGTMRIGTAAGVIPVRIEGQDGAIELQGSGTSELHWLNPAGDLAWVLSRRDDVGGVNDDLKLIRYVGGVFQGQAFQIRNSDGNVGIGTTVPDHPLTVSTDQSPGGYADVVQIEKASATPIGSYASLSFDVANEFGSLGLGSTTQITDVLETSGNRHGLGFWTRPIGGPINERMRIDGNGNVGIGTASPAYKLDVSGAARATDGIKVPIVFDTTNGTAPLGYWVIPSSSPTTIPGMSRTIAVNGPSNLDILFSGTFRSIVEGQAVTVHLYVDDAEQVDADGHGIACIQAPQANQAGGCTLSYYASVGAGNHTVEVRAARTPGNTGWAYPGTLKIVVYPQ